MDDSTAGGTGAQDDGREERAAAAIAGSIEEALRFSSAAERLFAALSATGLVQSSIERVGAVEGLGAEPELRAALDAVWTLLEALTSAMGVAGARYDNAIAKMHQEFP